MLHERRDVLGTLPQRRDMDRQHVEAKQQILPEQPLLCGLRKLLVGRGNHPHVHGDRLLATDPLDHAGFEHSQQLRLRFGPEIADLVEGRGCAVRELEPAETPLSGAGEGAPLVPEHLRLDQVLGDRGAIDADERMRGPGALAVNRRGAELLAGTRFARDQHARLGGRNAGDACPHVGQRLARSDQRIAMAQRVVQPAILGAGTGELERATQRQEHPLGRERLLEE